MSGTGGRNPEGATGESRPAPKARPAQSKASRKAHTTVELQAAVAERERQLRDLTEQSLDLLDRLAEAQRRETEHHAVAEHADRLTRALDDVRRRLRTAGGVVLRAAADQPAVASVEVVVWGGDEATVRARLDALAPATSITWVGPAAGVPAWAGERDRVRWLAAEDTRTPAQCWNLAMAATEADTVLFLGPTAHVPGDAELAAVADDPSVAIAQPPCARDGHVERGHHAAPDLAEFTPIPMTAGAAPEDIPFANPAAFVVRRGAFEIVGMFDESLLGDLALVDFILRARTRGFRVLGIATPHVALLPGHRHDVYAARDRLLLLASHRPSALGAALARDSTLWELAAEAVAPFVAELFARLPLGEASASAKAAILGSLVANAAPATKVIAALHDLLDTQVAVWTEPPLPAAATELAALHARVESARSASIGDALATLDAVLAFERRWVPQLATAQLDATRQHADAVRRAEKSEQTLEQARRDVQIHQEGLQVVAHAIDMVGRPEPARIRERLLDLRRDAEHLASLLAATGAPSPTALIEELYGIRTQLATGRDAIAERDAELAAHRRELAERERMIAERDRRLERAETRVDELTRELAAHTAGLASLGTLAEERGRWIAALLAEVCKRRLRRRQLLEHERAFLAQQARTP